MATAAQGHYVRISEALRADVYYDDIRLSDELMVVPGLSEAAIIGVETLQKWRIKLDIEHDSILIDPKVTKFIPKQRKHKATAASLRLAPCIPAPGTLHP